ncbi:hypothetical protein ACFVH7_12455 [Kitasatospora indigofera]|uniref:hypothetical protein n=1 Tax=Kitasatospora indigofera TaxID=67307 RepID=UPI00363302F4
MHGVAVTGLDHATYQHRRLLADFGFSPLAGSADLVLTGDTDNVFIHGRQTVAALRSTGARVDADPAFDYAQHPGHASPAAAAAGPDPRVVTAGPNVAVGAHPQHGIVATNAASDPRVTQLLVQAGFYRVKDTALFAMTGPLNDRQVRATAAVASLRAAGLSVAADLPYETPRPAQGDDPFETRVFKAQDRAQKPTAPADPQTVEDPFLTKVVHVGQQPAAPGQDPEPSAPDPARPAPFATQLHPAPPAERSAPDGRMAALLANRQQSLATIEEILSALAQGLRDSPQSLDHDQVASVLDTVQSTLGGVRQDLETIAAAAPATTRSTARAARPAAAALGPRAQAARTTSLRLGRISAAQPVEAAAQPVDPRLTYSNHSR